VGWLTPSSVFHPDQLSLHHISQTLLAPSTAPGFFTRTSEPPQVPPQLLGPNFLFLLRPSIPWPLGVFWLVLFSPQPAISSPAALGILKCFPVSRFISFVFFSDGYATDEVDHHDESGARSGPSFPQKHSFFSIKYILCFVHH